MTLATLWLESGSQSKQVNKMFTKNQHVRVNDPQSRYHGKEAIILTAYGDYFDIQLQHSLLMRVVYEQLEAKES
ncbi:MAG: hypothetical protein Tp178MES00d2C33159851_34 [Prokaryotic dsDNA virus sp.]|nr:MAG: hypothetical protein Tp178MES00d2C33159851_34 [Prokaryotic dsDNA virus sp.]|tara:strand:+ start:79120 stop:79341 length:222 start_codon:yes stop_codon:yes gene_type:complete